MGYLIRYMEKINGENARVEVEVSSDKELKFHMNVVSDQERYSNIEVVEIPES